MDSRLHNHRCFYKDTISRKITTQSWRDLSIHERDYPLLGANPAFHSLGVVLLLILILLLLFLSSLLIMILLLLLLLLFISGSRWLTILRWLKKMSTFSLQKPSIASAKYSLYQPNPSSELHLTELFGNNRRGQKCVSFSRPKEIALGKLGSLAFISRQSRRNKTLI